MKQFLGRVVGVGFSHPNMESSDVGKMVDEWWLKIPERFENVELDIHQTMPNHLHGIIIINSNPDRRVGPPTSSSRGGLYGRPNEDRTPTRERAPRGAPTKLGDIIGAFKSITTNEYIHNVKNNNWPPFKKCLWQRNYYEHIIRNEEDLQRIREYIQTNPDNWQDDEYNSENLKGFA